ncbi:MAG: peptidoglycan DD-metalloendopeptidase family protein, partial [Acidobacteriota bacterium]|nr:peptidoglycan DD-metalloendopeptidase family protein [Acidobacteriota bacterium]
LTALTANSSLPATRITLPLRPFKGEIEAPVPGNVTASFCGERPSAFRTTVARGGIEFAVVVGEPIRAVHEGQVAFAGPFEELGTLVIVDHGDQSFSLYGYLQSLQTSAGAWVDAGAELGTAGSSPTGAPALYFELRVDGRPVDPLEWLKLLS